MKVVEYTDYELNDLFRFLEYAKSKKNEDYKNGKLNFSQYQYEIGIIKDLMSKAVTKTYKKGKKNEQILKIM